MLTFTQTILKLLNEYKAILRRQLPYSEWQERVQLLGLKRKNLKSSTEVALYHKALKVADMIDMRVKSESDIPSWYFGLDEFGQFLKNTLAEYQIENHRVVHSSQQASRALVEAFQLMQNPNATFNGVIEQKLQNCGHIIARFGTAEQQDMFTKAIKEYEHNDVNFFFRLNSSFERYLEGITGFFSEEYNPELEADTN